MNFPFVLNVLSMICFVVACAMAPCFAISLYDNSLDSYSFALSIIAGILTSLLLSRKTHNTHTIGIREGVGITGLSWITATLLGALPLWFSGVAPSYTDAFFEIMSGFTTTGATIFTDIEALPRGILLWRSLTHWIGGMGIIVLSLAVLPFLGVSGMEMYKAEVPGITAGKVTPRLHQTAARLWTVYVSLTLAETSLLIIAGMNPFDAFTHSCSTIATGGFSTKNNSIAHFPNPYIQWTIIIFMFASGVNFLYFILVDKNFREFFSDDEFKK